MSQVGKKSALPKDTYYVSPAFTAAAGYTSPYYPTIQAAINAAAAVRQGLVIVYAGTYTEDLILKAGVDLDFMDGAILNFDGDGLSHTAFSDNGGTIVCNVAGMLNLQMTYNGAEGLTQTGLKLTGAGSMVVFEAYNATITCFGLGSTAKLFDIEGGSVCFARIYQAAIKGAAGTNFTAFTAGNGFLELKCDRLADIFGGEQRFNATATSTMTVEVVSATNFPLVFDNAASMLVKFDKLPDVRFNCTAGTLNVNGRNMVTAGVGIAVSGGVAEFDIQDISSAAAAHLFNFSSGSVSVRCHRISYTGTQHVLNHTGGDCFIGVHWVTSSAASTLFYLNGNAGGSRIRFEEAVSSGNGIIVEGISGQNFVESQTMRRLLTGGPVVNIVQTGGRFHMKATKIYHAGNSASDGGVQLSSANTGTITSGLSIVLTNSTCFISAVASNIRTYGTIVSNRAKDVNTTVTIGTLIVDASVI